MLNTVLYIPGGAGVFSINVWLNTHFLSFMSPSCCGVILLFDYKIFRYQLLSSKSIWCAYVNIYIIYGIYIYDVWMNIIEQYLEHYVYIYILHPNSWYFHRNIFTLVTLFGGFGSGWRMLGFWESLKVIGWKQQVTTRIMFGKVNSSSPIRNPMGRFVYLPTFI